MAGVPAHVTILYPFIAPADLDPAVRHVLAGVAAEIEPFDVRFGGIGRFPGSVYAAPEPSVPFVSLTEAVAARFPDFPPYGGAFAEIVPHLTVAESTTAPLDAIGHEAGQALPFHHRVSRLEVLVQGPDERWRPRWRLRLGVRP